MGRETVDRRNDMVTDTVATHMGAYTGTDRGPTREQKIVEMRGSR